MGRLGRSVATQRDRSAFSLNAPRRSRAFPGSAAERHHRKIKEKREQEKEKKAEEPLQRSPDAPGRE